MSVGEKIVNTGGGAVKDGIGWGLKGIVIGAIVGGLVCGALPLALLAAFSGIFATALGGALAVAGCAALGAVGAYFAGMWTGINGAGLGVVKGGLFGFFKPTSRAPSIEQQLAVEQDRGLYLREQVAARQAAAAGFDNPNATSNNAANVQQSRQEAPGRTNAPAV